MRTTLRPLLLAEDNPADAELTLGALRHLRLANEIVLVPDGAEALDFLHRRGRFAGRSTPQPAALLLDLKMPRMDGLETLRQIRNCAELHHLPVVLFTSSREESDIVRGYTLGTNAYVVKPVGFTEFVAAISGLGIFWALLNETTPDRC